MMIDPAVLEQVVTDVCESMLGFTPVTHHRRRIHPSSICASVEIRGKCQWVVEVITDIALAQNIARVMFLSDDGSVTSDEIRDALGEVANMIGGNLKGIMGDEAELSLPTVHDRWTHCNPSTPADCEMTFEFNGSCMTVALHRVCELACHCSDTLFRSEEH